MKTFSSPTACVAFLAAIAWHGIAHAQDDYIWVPTTPSNYNVLGNWNGVAGNFVPSSEFNERATIDNGGTALVTGSGIARPAGIRILDGTLDVQSGGTLNVEDGTTFPNPGPIDVGFAGDLRVAGTLTGPSLSSTGVVRTVGAGSNLDVSGNFDHSGSFIAELTSGAHGPVSVGGTASLSGLFEANFNGAPTGVGNTFTIFDAASITGGFDSIAVSGLALGSGQLGVFTQIAGGNGALLQFSVEQRLALNVNRTTGVMSISNPAGSPVSFDLDGYRIDSAVGSLDPTGWNSLDDQAVAGWQATGAGGTDNLVAELNPTTASTLAGGQSLALGTLYDPRFVSFGQETEDYVFSYRTDDGVERQGVVEFTGDKQFNNVVLTIDTATGNAEMRNESPFSIDIDGYTINSESGSLLPGYDSLEDQGALEGNWLEASPTTNSLSELMSSSPDTVTRLKTNEGWLFDGLHNTAGSQDVTFQYLVAGSDQILDGAVVFANGLPTVPLIEPGPAGGGDVNNDGLVNGLDFLLIQRTDATLIADWQAEFGISAAVAQAQVPEPTALTLASILTAAAFIRRRRTK